MKYFIYFLAILAIAVQLPTAADVFLATFSLKFIDPSIKWVLAYGYALVFETSLLIFVLQRRHKYAFVFAFFSLLINLISHDLFPWLTASAAFLISIQLPIAIAIFSHELERLKRRSDEAKAEGERRRAEAEARMDKIKNSPPPKPTVSRNLIRPVLVPGTSEQYEPSERVNPVVSLPSSNGHHKEESVAMAHSYEVATLKPVKETLPANCTCVNCGTGFYSKTGKGTYCSDKCRAAFYRKKQNDQADGNQE